MDILKNAFWSRENPIKHLPATECLKLIMNQKKIKLKLFVAQFFLFSPNTIKDCGLFFLIYL